MQGNGEHIMLEVPKGCWGSRQKPVGDFPSFLPSIRGSLAEKVLEDMPEGKATC